ncbi:hypothetical protein M408DRAFT_110267 [Serendipita vermifera MAFF 305830]|uniref:Uncharacterized protein n=1 Tax=Serendipita vermifera MAFF 305830 TaxID=933852 RepID=A0A0C2WV12_SERVB|nr:hypothetical protein M408DRAFT_110267 [Serendipita vermifera MAFF 305830]
MVITITRLLIRKLFIFFDSGQILSYSSPVALPCDTARPDSAPREKLVPFVLYRLQASRVT